MEKINIGKLKPNDSNPRYIRDEKFEKLVRSIQGFPEMLEKRPIVVDENMVVLGGNMRLRAAKKAGLKEIPTIIADDWTEQQKREFIIKDNASFGDWDYDVLANEWQTEELEEWGLEIESLYVGEEKEPINYEPKSVSEIQTEIRIGDYVEIGDHRMLCADSTDPNSYDKIMKGESADLAHNDPPYGMKKESQGVLNDNLNFDELLEFNKKWIHAEISHLKPNGSWYCWGIDEPLMDIYSVILKPMIRDSKITYRNLITWSKGAGMGQLSELHRMYATADEKCLFIMMGKERFGQNKDQFPEEWRPTLEYLIEQREKMGWTTKEVVTITGKTSASHYFTESQFMIPTKEHYNKLKEASNGQAFTRDFETIKLQSNQILKKMRDSRAYFDNIHDNMNNVWNIGRTTQNERKHTGGHATPKPIELCERVIKSSCPEQGIVIDAFLGSGSTMIAAQRLNRKCYGIELDPKYCQVVLDRMLAYDPSLEVKINGKAYQSK